MSRPKYENAKECIAAFIRAMDKPQAIQKILEEQHKIYTNLNTYEESEWSERRGIVWYELCIQSCVRIYLNDYRKPADVIAAYDILLTNITAYNYCSAVPILLELMLFTLPPSKDNESRKVEMTEELAEQLENKVSAGIDAIKGKFFDSHNLVLKGRVDNYQFGPYLLFILLLIYKSDKDTQYYVNVDLPLVIRSYLFVQLDSRKARLSKHVELFYTTAIRLFGSDAATDETLDVFESIESSIAELTGIPVNERKAIIASVWAVLKRNAKPSVIKMEVKKNKSITKPKAKPPPFSPCDEFGLEPMEYIRRFRNVYQEIRNNAKAVETFQYCLKTYFHKELESYRLDTDAPISADKVKILLNAARMLNPFRELERLLFMFYFQVFSTAYLSNEPVIEEVIQALCSSVKTDTRLKSYLETMDCKGPFTELHFIDMFIASLQIINDFQPSVVVRYLLDAIEIKVLNRALTGDRAAIMNKLFVTLGTSLEDSALYDGDRVRELVDLLREDGKAALCPEIIWLAVHRHMERVGDTGDLYEMLKSLTDRTEFTMVTAAKFVQATDKAPFTSDPEQADLIKLLGKPELFDTPQKVSLLDAEMKTKVSRVLAYIHEKVRKDVGCVKRIVIQNEVDDGEGLLRTDYTSPQRILKAWSNPASAQLLTESVDRWFRAFTDALEPPKVESRRIKEDISKSEVKRETNSRRAFAFTKRESVDERSTDTTDTVLRIATINILENPRLASSIIASAAVNTVHYYLSTVNTRLAESIVAMYRSKNPEKTIYKHLTHRMTDENLKYVLHKIAIDMVTPIFHDRVMDENLEYYNTQRAAYRRRFFTNKRSGLKR